jgi:hypothetical protein
MMSDLLSTCYSDYISIGRPQTLTSSLNNSFEEERVPSPVSSVSSRVSCFSQRLLALDKKRDEEKIKLATGRGRAMDADSSQIDMLIANEIIVDDGSETASNTTSPIPSIINSRKFCFDNKEKDFFCVFF